ncbi:MAG: hypothetical protein OEV89_02100 [Desulfobulbaceae bacterium]|nr:hypothetical protein [Desulfobulbaceae bacterium]
MAKSMTEKKGAGVFMAVVGGIGAAVGLWAFAALSFSLSKAGLGEVVRQYMVAVGLIGEQATLVDFYTHIKGVEYLVCVAFFGAFPVFFKYVNTPKVTVPSQH